MDPEGASIKDKAMISHTILDGGEENGKGCSD